MGCHLQGGWWGVGLLVPWAFVRVSGDCCGGVLWRGLQDHFRKAGDVSFTNILPGGNGVVEYRWAVAARGCVRFRLLLPPPPPRPPHTHVLPPVSHAHPPHTHFCAVRFCVWWDRVKWPLCFSPPRRLPPPPPHTHTHTLYTLLSNEDDMKNAIKTLDDSEFKCAYSTGKSFIRVRPEKGGSGGGGGGGGGRGRDRSPRRSRSPSPRKGRSPSPRKGRSPSPRGDGAWRSTFFLSPVGLAQL
jgi:hypothetical protein